MSQVGTVKSEEVFRVEVIDWTNGQIKDSDSAEDVKNVDLTSVHNLSGPIAVTDKASLPCLAAMPAHLARHNVVSVAACGPDPALSIRLQRCLKRHTLRPCFARSLPRWQSVHACQPFANDATCCATCSDLLLMPY